MKAAAAIILAAAIAGASSATAGSRARLVEAYAVPAFSKSTPMRIVPISEEQARDPAYKALANMLGDTLVKQGFQLVSGEQLTPIVVTLEYRTAPIILKVARQGSVNDSAYRMLIVTGFDMANPHAPTLAWQTAMDEYGIATEPLRTIPSLIRSAARHYGAASTPLGLNKAAWCADNTPFTGMRLTYSCKSYSSRPMRRFADLLADRGENTPISAGR